VPTRCPSASSAFRDKPAGECTRNKTLTNLQEDD